MGVNIHMIIGNLVRDPELRYTAEGTPVCNFTVAVNANYKDRQGNRPVEFFDVEVWREVAENCAKYLSKGQKVFVSGSGHVRTYEDREGIKRKAYRIRARQIEFLNGGKGGRTNGSGADKQRSEPAPQRSGQASNNINVDEDVWGDDLPLDDNSDIPF